MSVSLSRKHHRLQVEGAGHNDLCDVVRAFWWRFLDFRLPVSPTPNASLFQDREEYDRQIRQFFERMGEESSTKQWAAAGSGGSDLAASLQSRQLS